jgi:hypothetical protein
VSPKWRVRAAWALLVVCLVAWPATALTVAKDEPQFILGLSWTALILTSLDIVTSSDVRAKQEGEDSGEGAG